MVGTATLTGRFSVAVVTASPESKVNICEVFIVLYSATDVVSAPAVIFDNELPLITAGQRKFPKTPVIRRIASPCAEPAARFPPVQARKRAGRGKNPFLFAMLFEKNIEIFSDPNPSVLCVFSICPPPFRACTGEVAQAGGSTQDTGRNVVASWTTGWEAYFVPTIAPTGAAFTTVGNAFELTNGFGQRVEQPFYAGIDASRVWGEHAGAEFAPTHVCIPVIIYLGIPA